MMRWGTLGLALMPGAVWAEGAPAAFYVGLYRVIGVDGAGPVDTFLRIDVKGEDLIVTTCGATGTMVLPSVAGDEHYISVVIDGRSLTCDPFSTYDNYPLLACYDDADTEARLTLWPADDFAEPLPCGN